jgi:hypothetical protein
MGDADVSLAEHDPSMSRPFHSLNTIRHASYMSFVFLRLSMARKAFLRADRFVCKGKIVSLILLRKKECPTNELLSSGCTCGCERK